MGNNPKFRVLAGLMLAIFVFVSAAWTPQPAVAQEAAPVTVEIVVPAMTAETNNQPVPPPPSGWPECDPERGGTQLACQGKADGRLAQFGYAGAPWSNPGAAYAHLVGAVKPNGEEVFSHCTASMAAFWTGSDCYPVEKELSLSANATCEGWSVEASVSVEGAAISFSPASEGIWQGEFVDGQVMTVSATATWASGESVTRTVVIERPDCRPAAPQCTKDGFATVYVTVTYTDGKGRVQPLEGQRIGLDVDRDGSIEYADVSNHNGELMFHVALVHWSRHSDLVYLGDARETDPQTWGDVAVTWGDDQSGKPLDEQRHGWLWGLTDCISAFGAVQVGLPTPINPPVAALPAAPCEEQGG